MLNRREIVATGLSAIVGGAAFAPYGAAAQISGTAFIISGFPAGGIGDLISRPMAEKMRGSYATNVLVDSKVGAGGRLAAEFVKRSNPDGLTILQIPSSVMVLYPHIYKSLNYDPLADFAPVALIADIPQLVVVRVDLGVSSFRELLDYARKNPGKLSFGVQGLFGEMRMTLEHFKKTAGMSVTHVPYNSGAQAIIDLLSDRLDAMFLVIPPIKQHVQDGKLIALATLNATRVQAVPNIPTMAELGRPEMTSSIWFGYLAPAKTPDAIMNKLVQAFQALKSDQALKQRVIEMGAELTLTGPAEFGTLIDQDRRRYGKIVAEGNLATQN